MFNCIDPLSLVLILCFAIRNSDAALRSYNLTIHSEHRAPDGVSREVYLINNQLPGPLIEAEEGDDLEVFVQNDLEVETAIHWHGILQQGTPHMDGVPGVTQFPIPPGDNFTYRFSLKNEYGFYWYHSHVRAYYSDSVRGSLMVHPSPSRLRPFDSLAGSSTELAKLLQAERNAAPILLTDWYHQISDAVFSQYLKSGIFPSCVNSLLANGYGRVQCLPDYILQAGTGLGIVAASSANNEASQSTTTVTGSMSTDSTILSVSADSMPMDMSTDSMPMDMSSESMPMDMSTSSISMDMSPGPMSTMDMSTYSMSMDMPGMFKRMNTEGMTMATMSSNHMMPSPSTVTASVESIATTVSEMAMSVSSMSSMSSMSTMSDMTLNARGCTPPMMYRSGFNISSLPTETCTNTSSSLLTIPADPSRGWLALNLVNAGSVSRLSVSLDAHSMFVYAADGLFVDLQEVKVLHISLGQRYSVMIKLDQTPRDYLFRFASYPSGDMQQVVEDQAILSYNVTSVNMTSSDFISSAGVFDDPANVWMLVNGSEILGSYELDEQSLAPFEGHLPLAHPRIWVVDGYPYSEAYVPIIYGNASDGWNANTTLHMPFNSTIDLIMNIASDSMDTMGHPMHLHGHKFWVLGSGSGTFPYERVADAPQSMINLKNPPYRDTVDLPPSGWAAIRYVTDNPGAWLFHCHMQWHLMSGMALVLVEGDDQLPSLVGTPMNATGSSSPITSASTPASSTAVLFFSSSKCPLKGTISELVC
ncbi:multicopper oxidase-domain-containing protein [Lipomyces tetrasporus]|uniref:Multicopper oxidase-domain-containing protein n=1 Tax=Lipomyces tetrasporus TaxID=54092 RepID=A0AAD7QKX1_9ASCO|nr:multicopper oxidase-domain-containing protein [Lipomyces tetrasporus]KAJ8097160.1 multicopper oxidase-domain-containing protein [Lipomyces tetrasporus]